MTWQVEEAVEVFMRLQRAEVAVEKRRLELNQAIARVAPEDMAEYVGRTNLLSQ